jgi:mannose-1-phosphate guanylyltransferase
MNPKQAFILAGGKGTRLGALTVSTPKPLIEVQEKAILFWVLKNLERHKVKEVILSVGHMHQKIVEAMGKNFGEMKISYSVESEPLGTGGALKNAQDLLEGKFIMLNGDNLADFDYCKMNEVHETNDALGTIALIEVREPQHFGIAKLENQKIVEFVEKPLSQNAPSNLANAGAYILEKEALSHLPSGFNLIEKTLFPVLAQKQKLFGCRHEGQWFPTDTIQKLEFARKKFKP